MLTWYRTNRITATGVLACLLFGGIEWMVFLADGVSKGDMNKPAAVLAYHAAALFTDPPSLVRAGSDRAELTYRILLWWQALITVVFAALLWLRPRLRRRPRLGAIVLGAQVVAAAISMSALLYVLAAEFAVHKPLRQGLRWLAAQMTLLLAGLLYMVLVRGTSLGDDNLKLVFMYGAFGLVFQAIAFCMAQIAVRERQARLALGAANARLMATQSMLGDTVRAMERLRIARDLHDAVGHHLTALNLHLDLALRQSDSAAPESLRTSRELAHSLLAEVRSVVSSERREQRINLRSALATMCDGIPAPRIDVAFDEQVDIDSAVVANTLFYCVQEAVTNAARHAQADLLTIDIRRRDSDIVLTVKDDGRGSANAPEGNGLRGMRERVAEQGGSMRVDPPGRGRGFGFEIALPSAGSRA